MKGFTNAFVLVSVVTRPVPAFVYSNRTDSFRRSLSMMKKELHWLQLPQKVSKERLLSKMLLCSERPSQSLRSKNPYSEWCLIAEDISTQARSRLLPMELVKGG